jgi:hypothetical protein
MGNGDGIECRGQAANYIAVFDLLDVQSAKASVRGIKLHAASGWVLSRRHQRQFRSSVIQNRAKIDKQGAFCGNVRVNERPESGGFSLNFHNRIQVGGFAVLSVAPGGRMNKVSIANPCMGSFVGRSATAKHDTE